MLNHSFSAVDWEFGEDSYAIKAHAALQPGTEVFNSYGPKSNEELMVGYGFCVADNVNDRFGIGFNQYASDHIARTKRLRRGQSQSSKANDQSSMDSNQRSLDHIFKAEHLQHVQGQSKDADSQSGIDMNQQASDNITKTKRLDNEDDLVSESHYLYLRSEAGTGTSVSTTAPPYKFSPMFLEHSSIIHETSRETNGYRREWAGTSISFQFSASDYLCRNQLKVLSMTIMLLEKSLLELQSFGNRSPSNQNQRFASIYRQGQRDILETTVPALRRNVQTLLSQSPSNGILRLKYVLEKSPKLVLKDFRGMVKTLLFALLLSLQLF